MYKFELGILTDDLEMKRINKQLINNNVVCWITTNIDDLHGYGKSILCAYRADIAGDLQQRLSERRSGALQIIVCPAILLKWIFKQEPGHDRPKIDGVAIMQRSPFGHDLVVDLHNQVLATSLDSPTAIVLDNTSEFGRRGYPLNNDVF